MTHQQDIVIVDINIGKRLTHHRRQDITRLEQVVHTTRLRTFHNRAFGLWVLTPKLFGHHLVNRQRQHHFIGILAGVYLLT